jgi:hypothetical protein
LAPGPTERHNTISYNHIQEKEEEKKKKEEEENRNLGKKITESIGYGVVYFSYFLHKNYSTFYKKHTFVSFWSKKKVIAITYRFR